MFQGNAVETDATTAIRELHHKGAEVVHQQPRQAFLCLFAFLALAYCGSVTD